MLGSEFPALRISRSTRWGFFHFTINEKSILIDSNTKGQAILLRGRRRVGKSALVTEFVRRSGVPSVYFAAAKGAPLADELAQLTLAIAESTFRAHQSLEGTVRRRSRRPSRSWQQPCPPTPHPSSYSTRCRGCWLACRAAAVNRSESGTGSWPASRSFSYSSEATWP